MSDFNTVDPNGWEYDLQSVRYPSSVMAGRGNADSIIRSTLRTWATSKSTMYLGKFTVLPFSNIR